MNIEALRVFCSVVEHDSFSRGASANGISQSAATQCVRRLDEHFGVSLFDRRTRPFALSAEGEVCYREFQKILDAYDSLQDRIRAATSEIAGSIRVSTIYSVGLHGLSRSIQEFMRRYPRAKVRLEYLRPAAVYDAVIESRADLGIVSYPATSSQIAVVPLGSETMVLVAHPEHPLMALPKVTLRDLGGLEFIAFERDMIIRKEIDRRLRQQGVAVRTTMEFDNIETIKHAVEIGAGISILPESAVESEVQTGVLAARPIDEADLRRPLGVIYRDRRVLSPTTLKFIALLTESRVDDVVPAG